MKTDNQNNVKEGQQIGSKIKRSNIVNEFFWICSGANRNILRQCPTEYSKYFGIGGTIFFTAAMAALSGGYAFYTIFNEKQSSEFMQILSNPALYLAIAFGIFWGLLIFNLDRFIVNTMYSDGKHTISSSELFSGLPRIIIAIFLGIVISTPLEMKIFEDRIESQIVKDNAKRNSETKGEAQSYYDKQESLNKRLLELNAEQAQLEDNLHKASEDLRKEGEGSALSGKAGQGKIYREKQAYETKCAQALKRWNEQNQLEIQRLNEDINHVRKQIAQFEANIEEGLEEKGFCVRYEAFSNIKKENSAVRIVSIFIMLLFIIIETAPTLFKMMIASGPYDELLKEEMERKKAQAILNVSRINDDANTQIQIVVEKNKDKLAAEVAANKEILAKIASVQAELLETAIEEWRKEELAKIKANPSQYIQSNTKKS